MDRKRVQEDDWKAVPTDFVVKLNIVALNLHAVERPRAERVFSADYIMGGPDSVRTT
jgi:hypothetical protein